MIDPSIKLRKCERHMEAVSRVCLKDQCVCPGLLCEKCITEHHKHIKTCRINKEEEPFSYFSINSSRPKYLDYFGKVLASICETWDKGNQIIANQLKNLQSTFLFQLNLLCRTFALNSAAEVQEGLRFMKMTDDDQQDTKRNIEIVRSLHRNRENIQDLEEIKSNTQIAYNRVNMHLKNAFHQLNANFQKLEATLKEIDIFGSQKQRLPKREAVEEESHKVKVEFVAPAEQTVIKKEPIQSEDKNKQPPTINKQSQAEYTESQSLVLNINNCSQLQKPATISSKKHLKIQQTANPSIIIDSFLNNPFNIEYLLIESPQLANSENLTMILMCLQRLKVLVLQCDNEVWKCANELVHYENGKEAVLDRLQYYYDYRRGLEELDVQKFFPSKVVQRNQKAFPKDQGHYKLANYWSVNRKPPQTKATFDMIRRLKLKNIWLPNLIRKQFQFGIDDYDLTQIQEITLGRHYLQHASIPFSLQQKLKSATNIKSLTLIKTSHFMLNLTNFIKKMERLEVMVLEEVKFQGDQRHCQGFFSSLPKSCPLIRKIAITCLENVNIGFVAELPYLQTLILTKSKRVTFDADCQLQISHLNLFQADWNYLKLLKSLKPEQLHHLNLGLSTHPFKDLLASGLAQLHSLSSLCLDKISLTPEIIDLLECNKATLRNISISHCNTSFNHKLSDTLCRCEYLKIMDISKCDMEMHLLKNYPAHIQCLTISKIVLTQQLKLELFTRDISVIEV